MTTSDTVIYHYGLPHDLYHHATNTHQCDHHYPLQSLIPRVAVIPAIPRNNIITSAATKTTCL